MKNGGKIEFEVFPDLIYRWKVCSISGDAGAQVGLFILQAGLDVRHSEKTLDRIAGEIRDSIAAWTSDLERHDDTTMVFARRL
jgi:hypothetical protein